MPDPKKVSNYKILEIAQNWLAMVLFLTEYEYYNPRCHIASMTHEYESFEKRVSNYKKFRNRPKMVSYGTFCRQERIIVRVRKSGSVGLRARGP